MHATHLERVYILRMIAVEHGTFAYKKHDGGSNHHVADASAWQCGTDNELGHVLDNTM